MNIFDVTWGQSSNLIYAPLFLGAFVFLILKAFWIKTAVQQLSASKLARSMVLYYSFNKNIFKTVLWVIGLSGLFLALLQPQWNKKERVVEQEGRDLFIALDISRSMLAQDIEPNRLQAAKEKIKQLLGALSFERVGLILFSGTAVVQCPLTVDYGAFTMFLDQVDAQSISGGTTSLDAAMHKALQAFKAAQGRKTKLLVIFTDGEDFSSNLNRIKEQASQENMNIFTVGVGTSQGAPVPLFDEQGAIKGHQLDKKGNVVISRLNEGILQNIALDSGGKYIHMSSDDKDIKSLIKIVESYEKERFAEKRTTGLEEQYPYFVALSFVCLLLEWLI